LQGFVLLLGLVKETPDIVGYKGTEQQDKGPEKKKVNTNVQRKPHGGFLQRLKVSWP